MSKTIPSRIRKELFCSRMVVDKEASVKRGIPTIDKERCKGCGLCIANCPKKILSKADDVNSQGAYFAICTDVDACIACGACALMCPDAAIEIDTLAEAV